MAHLRIQSPSPLLTIRPCSDSRNSLNDFSFDIFVKVVIIRVSVVALGPFFNFMYLCFSSEHGPDAENGPDTVFRAYICLLYLGEKKLFEMYFESLLRKILLFNFQSKELREVKRLIFLFNKLRQLLLILENGPSSVKWPINFHLPKWTVILKGTSIYTEPSFSRPLPFVLTVHFDTLEPSMSSRSFSLLWTVHFDILGPSII